MPPRRGRGRRGGPQKPRNQQIKTEDFDEQESQGFSLEDSQISESSSDATNQVQNGTEQPGNPETVESSEPKVDTANVKVKEEESVANTGNPSNNVVKGEPGGKENDNDLPYKVKVSRLPAEYSLGDFHRYLRNTFRLSIDTIMSPGTNSPWLLVPFKTREEQESLVRLLHNHVWKKKSLRAIAFYGSLAQKNKLEGGDEPDSKKLRLEDVPMLTFEEEVLSESLPLYNVPYDEQNRLSVLDVQLLSNKLHAFMCVRNPALAGWAEAMCEKNDGSIFKIEPLKCCSVLEGYRSKCKFRIGKNTEGEITVGFCLNDNEFKILGVQPGDRLIHLPDSMKNAAKKFQDFIRASGKEPYDKKKKTGYWDHIIVRVTPENSLMLIVVMFHNNLTDQQLDGIKKEVKEYFVNGDGKDLNLYSLYFQLLSDKVPLLPSDKLELLHGESHFYEHICGIKFYVGPYSILSINSSSMENIYNAIAECASATPDDIVLDLCSGSGGIAFTMANKCKKVYAIESLEDHIKDAQKTKEINNIENVEFIKGKVEEELGPLLEKLGDIPIIPIIDPPRQGLVQKAINLLRSYQNIKKLVYVCSNSKMGAKNFLDLCTSTSEKKENATGNGAQTADTGLPFLPSKAIPVDVAPHTINNTIIILFERIDPSGFPAPKKPPPVPLKRQQKKEEKKKRRFHNPRKFSRGSTFRGRPGRKFKGSTATRGGSSAGTRGGGQAGNFFRRGGSQAGFSSSRFPPPLLRQMDPALSLVAKYERRIAELEQQDRAFKAGLTMGLQALGSRGGPGGGGGGGGGNANFDNFESLTSNMGNNYDNFAGQFQRDRQGWQRGGRNFGNVGFGFGGGGGGGGSGTGSGSGSNFSGGFGSGLNFNNLGGGGGGGFGNFDRGRSGSSGGGGNFNSNFNPNFNSNFNSNFGSNFSSNLGSNFNSNFSSSFGGGGGGGFRNYQGNKHRR